MSTRAHTRGGPEPRDAVSPELVLVDPELAVEARSRLADRPPFPPERERCVVAADGSRPLDSFGTAVVGTEATSCRVAEQYAQPAYPYSHPTASARRTGRLRPAAVGFALGALAAAVAVGGGGLGGDRVLFGAPSLAAPAPSPAGGVRGPGQTSERASRARIDAATPAPAQVAQGDRPAAGPSPTPPAAAQSAGSARRDFVWPDVPSAAGYEFQLFRGSALVFRARVAVPRLELPAEWRFAGRKQTLVPGRYRWYVWTVSAATGQPAAKALIQARLDVRD